MSGPREIERKFLVTGDGWRSAIEGEPIPMRAGYISRRKDGVVRVRMEGGRAVLAIKGRPIDPDGRERAEFEWEIRPEEAEQMLAGPLLDGGVVRKVRHCVRVDGCQFSVDVFEHPRAGLVLAEIELPHRDADFVRPSWLGEEVTSDPTYANSNIAAEA